MKKLLPRILFTLFIIAIIFIGLYIFLLNDIPEKFEKGSEIGLFLYNFSLSYIAAVMFYFIVDFFPKKQRRKAMIENLEIHSERIIVNTNTILAQFNYPTDLEKINIDNYNETNLKKLLVNTPVKFKTGYDYIYLKNAPILKHIEIQNKEINKEIEELEKHIDLFSPELFKAMIDLKRFLIARAFIATVNMMRANKTPLTNLGEINKLLIQYLDLVKVFQNEWSNNKN